MMPTRKPLLLIPGLACDREVWRHQIENLGDLAEPIVTADLSKSKTMDEMASAALRVAPEKFLLAGHSMGGVVALEIVTRFPERVDKLCILSTTAEADTPDKREQRQKLIEQAEAGRYEEVCRALTDLFTHRPEIKEPVFSMLMRNEPAFVNQQRALMARRELLPELAKIRAPTLIILGSQDQDFPEPTREIARRIPHATLEVVDNCGHMSPMEQPEAVTTLMRAWIENF